MTLLISLLKTIKGVLIIGIVLTLFAGWVWLNDPYILSGWRIVNDTNQPQARHENAYIAVNGKFYLMGGRGIHPVEMYDPADSTWTMRSNTPNSISLHHFQAVELGDTIYVLASYTGDYPDEDAVEHIYKYDTVSDTWVVGSEIPVDRRRASAGVVAFNGKFYVVCGSTGGHGSFSVRKAQFDEYDPATDTWTPLPDAPRARDHVHAAVAGNKLYVAGGRDGGLGDNVPEVDVYDFTSGQWSTLPSSTGNIPTPRAGAASVGIGNYVVVIGGESLAQVSAHSEAEVLDTSTNTWTSIAHLNVGRHGTQAVLFQDKIYIVAGSGQRGGTPELTSQEVFDTMGQTSLPVELAPEFYAVVDSNRVVLNWRTLSESNNAGFEIQQLSVRRFETIGFVAGHGTSATPHDYTYTISDVRPGRHMFRLKQLDFDGGVEYSPVVSAYVEVKEGFHLGQIYPNPFNPQARFELTLVREQMIRIAVYDMLGRRVEPIYDGVLMPHIPHAFVLESSSWAGGKYILRVEGTSFSASRMFTVLK